ncbi:MAG: 2-C-methyl-D-erythritol 2,4-cyclodiphosphate synthase [Ignavibacteriae bacterium]|nr:2-C-methyl-D-erythritol 2,4-cyclodiphosphate synthase [Ignavibacteriota bacterium]
MLGGVRIPYHQGLLGHSDADVLLHAICDALLGAAGLGDIGKHFPDTSKKLKNASSIKLLESVKKILAKEGYEIVNVDSTVVLQWPKISPYSSRMITKIASSLKIKKNCVSVKATTNEGLGFLGRGVACAAYAVASIRRIDQE